MSDLTDSERARAAGAGAIVGAVLCIAGVMLSGLHGFTASLGFALLIMGAIGLAHAVALGLGLVKLPGDDHDRERDDRKR